MASLYDGLLNSPMLQLGAGLLAGGQPGGTFAGGLNMGLQNMMNMQRQQQATAMLGAQLQQMQWKRQQAEAEARAKALEAEQDRRNAARAGLLPGMKPTSKQLEAISSELMPGTPAWNEAMKGGPLVEVNTGNNQPNIWTPDQVAQAGLPPGTVVTQSKDGTPKILSSSDKENEGFASLEQMEDALTTYKSVLQETGTEILPTSDKLRLGAAHKNLLLEAKELFKLGVLTGPDLDLMEAVLADPTAITSQVYSKGALQKQLTVFEDKIKEARNRLNRQYGTNKPPPGFTEVMP